jgi:hypothetical protein
MKHPHGNQHANEYESESDGLCRSTQSDERDLSGADFSYLTELISENRQLFELLSDADLPISDNARHALEWLDGDSSDGGTLQ